MEDGTLNAIILKTGYEEIPRIGTRIGWGIVPIRIWEWKTTETMPTRKKVRTKKKKLSRNLKPY